jgi:hypothetical protein
MHHDRCTNSRSNVIQYDAETTRQCFNTPDRRRLENVEPSKKYKAHQQRFPCDRNRDQRDPLPRNFVDDHVLWVFIAVCARHFRCCRNADCYNRQRQQNQSAALQLGRDNLGNEKPGEHGQGGPPRPRTWPQLPQSRDRGNRACPQRSPAAALNCAQYFWLMLL